MPHLAVSEKGLSETIHILETTEIFGGHILVSGKSPIPAQFRIRR